MAYSDHPVGAVDLGGTKIYSAVLDGEGRMLGDDLRPTGGELGPATVIERMIASLGAACFAAKIPLRSLKGVGVAAPGPVDAITGNLSDPPNLPGWDEVPLGSILSTGFGLPVTVENDANAAALGEYTSGSGAGAQALIYVTVSTGIGGGFVFGGKLYRGASGAAGEIGHMVVQPDGALCGCGHLGCLEALASGTALTREGRAALAQGRSPILRDLVARAGGEVSTELVAQAAEQGDHEAAAIISRAGSALGIGLGNLVNLFNPDVFVIGGGAAKIGTPLLGPAEAAMRATIFAPSARHVEVRRASLEYAAIAGAAALARSA